MVFPDPYPGPLRPPTFPPILVFPEEDSAMAQTPVAGYVPVDGIGFDFGSLDTLFPWEARWHAPRAHYLYRVLTGPT